MRKIDGLSGRERARVIEMERESDGDRQRDMI